MFLDWLSVGVGALIGGFTGAFTMVCLQMNAEDKRASEVKYTGYQPKEGGKPGTPPTGGSNVKRH